MDLKIMQAFILLLGVVAWKIRPVSDSIIFWGQSWTSLDYWRIFEDSIRVEVQWMLWHSIILHTFSSTAAALEILRQIFSQYLQVLITFRTFVHMNQSLCTSRCFIKSIKMQITWSWMNIQEWAPELERHRGSKFVWVQFYFHHIGMVPLQVWSEL